MISHSQCWHTMSYNEDTYAEALVYLEKRYDLLTNPAKKDLLGRKIQKMKMLYLIEGVRNEPTPRRWSYLDLV